MLLLLLGLVWNRRERGVSREEWSRAQQLIDDWKIRTAVLNTTGLRSLCKITDRVGKDLMRGKLVEEVGGSIDSTLKQSNFGDECATTKKHLKISFKPTRV